MALALAPGGADATAAVFLLGEAGEGVAATLGEGGGGEVGSQSTPPPRRLLGLGLFLFPCPSVFRYPGELGQSNPERRKGRTRLRIHSRAAWAECPGSSGPGASEWAAGDARAWGAAAGAGRGPHPRRSSSQCGALGPRPRAGEAGGQWMLALVLRAHQAETQALLLRFVCCRGQWGAWASEPAHCPRPSAQLLQTLPLQPRQPLIPMWSLTPYDPELM